MSRVTPWVLAAMFLWFTWVVGFPCDLAGWVRSIEDPSERGGAYVAMAILICAFVRTSIATDEERP